MDRSRLFDVINKINSVLLLVVLVGGGILIITGIVLSNQWQDRRAVQVTPDDGGDEEIELILRDITDVPGHDTQYVKLHSRARGGKFSSYSGGGETRNVLFFRGVNLNTHWLYDEHTFYISEFAVLKNKVDKYLDSEKDKKEIAKAIYIEVIKSDTNRNEELDRNDAISVALADTNGENLKVIESDVQSVIDYNLVDEYRQLVLLFQKNDKVILKKFSLSTFEMLSENVIDEISRKL
ncbi:MAG: hypothetical protein DBP02_19620 [gamma proteobacterium symbiont of Ctena orbiculata]|nr:MAG: hypothetical protein DBP02_19620 [gamma proteobacterium symbiont of Ctena orbiculata]